jgi:hypothetical protein
MNRTDTKFVTTMEHLRQLLEMARHDYYICQGWQELGLRQWY